MGAAMTIQDSGHWRKTRRWQRMRRAHLAQNPVCVMCEAQGKITPAVVLDHVVPHKGDARRFWDNKNWQGLCKVHHDSSKQAIERSGFSKEIGVDGCPSIKRTTRSIAKVGAPGGNPENAGTTDRGSGAQATFAKRVKLLRGIAMKQRGRKSAASLAVSCLEDPETRLEPPRSLSVAERKVFVDLVASVVPEHFVPCDLPLVCAYVRAIALEELAAVQLRKTPTDSRWLAVWEKSTRALVALSLRLRLSPQARVRNTKVEPLAGRRKPWDIGEPDEHLETWE
jgi:5-methylcytosine-specific restriction protein A